MFKTKIIVLAMNEWAFVDDSTGEKRSGVTVWYINPSLVDGEHGIVPSKSVLALDEAPQPIKFPFIAEATMGIQVDLRNRNSLTLTGFTPVKSIDFGL